MRRAASKAAAVAAVECIDELLRQCDARRIGDEHGHDSDIGQVTSATGRPIGAATGDARARATRKRPTEYGGTTRALAHRARSGAPAQARPCRRKSRGSAIMRYRSTTGVEMRPGACSRPMVSFSPVVKPMCRSESPCTSIDSTVSPLRT